MSLDPSRHPCFNESARRASARIHLPVAPECNIQCNFCRRMYDCVNESRPGVTSTLLSPAQAIRYLDESVRRDPRIAVVGIAGPGDPFATPTQTLDTLRLVRACHPSLLLCVASNGLNVSPYVAELAALQVSHVTLTVNAIDPAIGARVYAWVRDGKHICRGVAGAELLWRRQREAIVGLKQHGVTVKINTIIIPGVNDEHVAEVAKTVADLGADVSNCVPLYPVEGTLFASIPSPSHEAVAAIREQVRQYLPAMEHCTRCRADAVGLLGESLPAEARDALERAASPPPSDERPHVAVATLEGILVNQHLGEADRLAIYTAEGDRYRLVETRSTPPAGGGRERWMALAETLADCRALLVSSAGGAPRAVLEEEGIDVFFMEGLIEDGLEAVYKGHKIRLPMRQHRCGSGCGGNGQGCQ